MDDLDLGSTIKGFSAGQKVFGRYTLNKILGRGGMGVVWLARDEELEREVALKFLPEVVAMDRQSVVELKRETRRSLELTHPHIVRIYDFVQDGRAAAISMEYVAGDTLASLKVDQPGHLFAVAPLEKWVAQLCEALDYAHAKAQIVHRDLKPANLMIDARGDLKIADFGIAASVSDSVSRVSAKAGSSGTPVYMSPQQMMGDKPAVTDDIYSLGATLYDLLTGKPPFYSGNILAQVQAKVPPSIAARRAELGAAAGGETVIPAAWEETIAACLAKDSTQRPQTAREVAQRLRFGTTASTAPFPFQVAPAKPTSATVRKPAVPSSPASAQKKSLPVLLLSIVVAALLLAGGLGYYFGIYAPEQQRIATEQQRIAAGQKRTADLKAEQDRVAEAARKTEAVRQAELARLAALRIPVTLRTNPAGAEVFIAGQSRGLAPVAGVLLPLGEHKVVARLKDHDDLEYALTVTEKGQTEWTLPLGRSTGLMRITSKPAEANFEIYPVNDFGDRAAQPVRKGELPGDNLLLPTGRYEVRVRSARSGAGREVVEKITVRRGETAAVSADVRGGSFTVQTTPAGATVYRGAVALGQTPLTMDEIGFDKPIDLEVRLERYLPARHTLSIADADHPATWDVALQLKPLLTLRPDFTKGPARLRVSKQVSFHGKGQTQSGTTVTPMEPADYQYATLNLYELSDPGRDGQWSTALSTFEQQTGTIPDGSRFKPGSAVRFRRNFTNDWSGEIVAGGPEKAPATPQVMTPSNPALWLSGGDVWPQGEAKVGDAWDVPLWAAPHLLSINQLKNPQGSIRGRLLSFDREAAQPWAELEYTFDLRGDVDLPASEIPAGTSATRAGSSTGTLRLRLEVAAGYVSHALLTIKGTGETHATPLTGVNDKREGNAMIIGGLLGYGLAKATETKPVKVDTVATYETTLEISAAPYDGPVQISQAAPAAQPVTVIFYRERKFLVSGAKLSVEHDGRQLGVLPFGGYLWVTLPAGSQTVTFQALSGPDIKQDQSLHLGPDPEAFYRCEVVFVAGGGAGLKVEPVSAMTGRAAVAALGGGSR